MFLAFGITPPAPGRAQPGDLRSCRWPVRRRPGVHARDPWQPAPLLLPEGSTALLLNSAANRRSSPIATRCRSTSIIGVKNRQELATCIRTAEAGPLAPELIEACLRRRADHNRLCLDDGIAPFAAVPGVELEALPSKRPNQRLGQRPRVSLPLAVIAINRGRAERVSNDTAPNQMPARQRGRFPDDLPR